mmetsp:Transcript_1045/g.1620  ORF Transcript_1045/g.1620 Transcript_1045/m.1620 type:complete len:334 (+) Transcript_1045:70-1071(+)
MEHQAKLDMSLDDIIAKDENNNAGQGFRRKGPYDRPARARAQNNVNGGGNAPPRGAAGSGNRVYVGNLSYDISWHELKDHMRLAGRVLRADVLQDETGRSKGCGIVEFASREEAQQAINNLTNTQLLGRDIFVREDRESKGVGLAGVVARRDGIAPGGGRGGGRGGAGPIQANYGGGAPPPRRAPVQMDRQGRQVYVSNSPMEQQDAAPRGRGTRGAVGAGGGGGGGSVSYSNGGTAALPPPPRRAPVPMDRTGRQIYISNLPWETSWQDLKDAFRSAGNVIRANVLLDINGRSKGCGTVLFAERREAQQAISMFNETEFNGRVITVHEDKYA